MGCSSTKAVKVSPLHTVMPPGAAGESKSGAATGSSAQPALVQEAPKPTPEEEVPRPLPVEGSITPPPVHDTAEAMAAGQRRKKKTLIKAVKDNDLASIEERLGNGEDIEQLGMWDNTPLLVACSYGNSDAALRLIEQRANITAKNEHGCTALHYASVEGMHSVAEALLASAASGEKLGGTATLANSGAAKLYNRHLDAYASRTPLAAAAESGYPAMVTALLEAQATIEDVGEDGRTALWCACRHSRLEAAKVLLRAGANAGHRDAEGASVLEAAAMECNEDLLLLLLANGVGDVNDTAGSPLLSAVRKGNRRCAEALLTHGASLDPKGEKPLHAACRKGNEYLVSLLVQHKADPSAGDAAGLTAYDLLRQRGLPDGQIYELLKPADARSSPVGATGES